VRAVLQQSHHDVDLGKLPTLLLPAKGRLGLRDYEKAFCADLKGGRDIFSMRGIDRKRGCMVIVRPDQFVAHVLPLDGFAALSSFFAGFMTKQDA
jgi:phenol 2-monooxygenase